MEKNKNTLEKKLQGEKPDSKLSMETNLEDFIRLLRGMHRSAKRKEVALHRVICMVSYLYDETDSTIVPRQIHTVGEFYSFTEKEILGFRGYGRKTWIKLNEWLTKYRLPSLKLPQEYKTDS